MGLVVVVVVAITTGCGYLGESPDDVDAITMTRAEAERTIIDGVEAVAAGTCVGSHAVRVRECGDVHADRPAVVLHGSAFV